MNYKYVSRDQPKGISQTPDYKRWRRIKECCENPKCKGYKNYGGRGIVFYKDWSENPLLFIEYIKTLENYGKGLTIDRENNNGNYEPGNLRWIDYHNQLCNRRIQKNNTTGYVGIILMKTCKIKKYRADLYCNGKNNSLGYYETIKEALDARNKFIIENNLVEYSIQTI